jgi:predicted lipoprotein
VYYKNKKIFKMKKIYILFCCFTILSCGKEKGTNNNDNVDRAAILDNLGNIIFERYTTFKESADSLNIFADSFQNHTNEANLIALRNAYIKTYKDFQKIQYFNFAKALELNIIDAFNFYPEDSTIILNAIQSNIYNIQTISNKAKGLQALDYLLFGIRSYSDAELISWYNATPNAKTYLVNITQEISRISNLFYNDWNTSYLSTFKTRQGIDRSSSFFLLTNALIENFEEIW